VSVQPGFDWTDWSVPTPCEAKAQRDRGMARTAQAAEDAVPDFGTRAAAVILRELATGPQSGEQLTLACRRAGVLPPRDDRAFGPVYMRLARAGHIVKAGTVPRLRGHHTAGGNLWRLA